MRLRVRLLLQTFSGLTNTLVGCCHAGDEDSMLLFRLYGDGTDKFIDRDAEKRNMQVGCRSSWRGSLWGHELVTSGFLVVTRGDR